MAKLLRNSSRPVVSVQENMTVEEAVKDAEFRDRDLLVFHNLSGELFVLHRRRDGQLELVEIP